MSDEKLLSLILKKRKRYFEYIVNRKMAIRERNEKNGKLFVLPIKAFLWKNPYWVEINHTFADIKNGIKDLHDI